MSLKRKLEAPISWGLGEEYKMKSCFIKAYYWKFQIVELCIKKGVSHPLSNFISFKIWSPHFQKLRYI